MLIRSIVMYHEQRASEIGSSHFDKDDDLAVDFVTAASNLRSTCYGIPTQSVSGGWCCDSWRSLCTGVDWAQQVTCARQELWAIGSV